MPNNPLRARCLGALVLTAIVIISSHPAAAAEPVEAPTTEDLPQALTLLAPFTCGTEWQGSTYSGHGAHNWNLDLNRTGDDPRSDLGQPILAQGDGTVVWFEQTGYNHRAGTYLEIDYGDVTVRYVHLVEGSIPEELAEVGATVRAGEIIGLLGATGNVSGPHLHLEYWDSAGLDDIAWYHLPRENQLPVAFDGEVMIATSGRPTAPALSTNCPEQAVGDRRRNLRSWRNSRHDAVIFTAPFAVRGDAQRS